MLSVAGVRDWALLLYLRNTGAQISGLVGTYVSDLDLQNKRLYVMDKGGFGHYIYFGEVAFSALVGCVVSRDPGDALFGLSRGSAYSMLRRLAVRCGVKRFNPHSFRHAFARIRSRTAVTFRGFLG